MVEENLVVVVAYMRIVIEASAVFPCDTMVAKRIAIVGNILVCCETEVIIVCSTTRMSVS